MATTLKIHAFKDSLDGIEIPTSFTFPFNYTPHTLAVKASAELQEYLLGCEHWSEEIAEGKMFGVLVIRDKAGKLGFLAAFSGLLAKSNTHDYFVPAIYDMQHPDGYFREKEAEISNINSSIDEMLNSKEYSDAIVEYSALCIRWDERIEEAKNQYKSSKLKREERRKEEGVSEQTLRELVGESIAQKNNIRALKTTSKEEIVVAKARVEQYVADIKKLKIQRAEMSAALQTWLFEQFKVNNAFGEQSDMVEIFSHTALKVPPAGAGECAAPKLLQYAYQNQLQPIVMAEFWKGRSPEGQVRVDGEYYPACKSKCHAILGFMLQGLKMDKDPMEGVGDEIDSLDIIYKDEFMVVVNKPSGLLSTRGVSSKVSVESLAQKMFAQSESVKLVHRLDMATSGVLVIALTSQSHKAIQAQFEERTIKKHYVALLDGKVNDNEGVISLPLSCDYAHRPCQMVDFEGGKEAVTRYKVLERRDDGRTLVRYFPLTGRTHQLRLHSAHSRGLGAPICGDNLYGRRADRLYLHAEYLRMNHPVTRRSMKFFAPSPF